MLRVSGVPFGQSILLCKGFLVCHLRRAFCCVKACMVFHLRRAFCYV